MYLKTSGTSNTCYFIPDLITDNMVITYTNILMYPECILQGNTSHGKFTLFLRETVLHGNTGDGKYTIFLYSQYIAAHRTRNNK